MNLENLRGKFLIGLGLGMAVVFVLGVYADFPKLVQTISGFDWRLLPAILGLTLLNYGLPVRQVAVLPPSARRAATPDRPEPSDSGSPASRWSSPRARSASG